MTDTRTKRDQLEHLKDAAHSIKNIGRKSGKTYAWSQYHHALQAAYESGTLIVIDTPPAPVAAPAAEPVAWRYPRGAGPARHWNFHNSSLKSNRTDAEPLYASPPPSAAPTDNTALVEAAAKLVDDRLSALAEERGIYDPSTNVTEFRDDRDEWLAGELQEVVQEIRALASRDAAREGGE